MNSVEGYIAHKVHGFQEGETAFGPGFVICAILDWAGSKAHLDMFPYTENGHNIILIVMFILHQG